MPGRRRPLAEPPVRQAQIIDDLAGDAAGCLVVRAAAVTRLGRDPLHGELHVEMEFVLVAGVRRQDVEWRALVTNQLKFISRRGNWR
jgi:hypothetical protein